MKYLFRDRSFGSLETAEFKMRISSFRISIVVRGPELSLLSWSH